MHCGDIMRENRDCGGEHGEWTKMDKIWYLRVVKGEPLSKEIGERSKMRSSDSPLSDN